MKKITNFSKSDAYRSVIHDLIPGGAHTYSKGDDQFPLRAPAAISHGKGAWVWDLDGNQYLDCSMGLTSVGLGHAYEPVLARVREELEKGVNFQRPSYIEREMAEKFLHLVPGHDMIKFGKNGSLVTTAAVKLARAFTGRKLVAFPAEHPFYSYDDWFIGKTACPAGVPPEIAALSVTYKADDLDSLKALFDQYPNQIACVISEPEKQMPPPPGYVAAAIDLAHAQGALYILDEMITGFKTDLPGSLKKFNVVPDMATWGKGIANGFSFTCLTGKKEIMELGGIRRKGQEKVFLVSTTHGAETHALAAAMATIDIMVNENVVAHNLAFGREFLTRTSAAIQSAGLEKFIEPTMQCEWMPLFTFRDASGEISAGMRTLMMQEMIARGVLFQVGIVPCFSHNEAELNHFMAAWEDSLPVYKQALDQGWESLLVGEAAKPVFRKYL